MPARATFSDLMGLLKAEPLDPAELPALFAEPGDLTPDHLAVILSRSWALGNDSLPLRVLSREQAVRLFREVGYLWNGMRYEAMRPTEPVTVYRGAWHEYRDGLSWTTSLDTARYFARRHPGGGVYALTAPPSWLLSRTSAHWLFPGGEHVIDVADVSLVHLIEPPEEEPMNGIPDLATLRTNPIASGLRSPDSRLYDLAPRDLDPTDDDKEHDAQPDRPRS